MQNEIQNTDTPIVSVEDLIVHYETVDGVVEAVNNISFSINKGEALGMVGETGAGKSTLALSILRLLPKPPSRILKGTVRFNGEDIYKKTDKEMRDVLGSKIGMIFQDPMTALNPVIPIGKQIAEVITLHEKCSAVQAQQKAIDMLDMVGIHSGRYNDYPHQMSGGMKQRVIIAMALVCSPELLIADEPTTALDVTIQAQLLDMMKELRKKMGMAMLLITHDFGIVSEICDKCAVIYAGEIVEYGTLEHLFENPSHPYTKGLFGSVPSLDDEVERLTLIKGRMIDPRELPEHCSFFDRCDAAVPECKNCDPKLAEIETGHFVKCIHAQAGRG